MKKVLVTGASKGIGAAICAYLVEKSYEVVAPTRQEMDLADVKSVKNYIENHPMDFDILINNAGVNPIANFLDLTEENWDLTMQVNLKAGMLLAKAVLPHMQNSSWGRIVNISSTFSKVTKAQRSAYTASKSAMDGLTRNLAVEFGKNNVLVNSICPGFIMTDLTRQNNSPEQLEAIAGNIPMRRLAAPEEVAKFVGFMVSEENTYITGQSLSIDGGFICQ